MEKEERGKEKRVVLFGVMGHDIVLLRTPMRYVLVSIKVIGSCHASPCSYALLCLRVTLS